MRAAARSAILRPAITQVVQAVSRGRAPLAPPPRWVAALVVLHGAQSIAACGFCSVNLSNSWASAQGRSPPKLACSGTKVAAGRLASSMAAEACSSSTGAVVMYTTVPSRSVGEDIATALVEARLAACVSLIGGSEGGMTSIYMWEGKIHKDAEVLLMIKTRASLVDTLTAKIKGLHPYDEPEVIALPVVGGSSSYLQWIQDTASASAGS